MQHILGFLVGGARNSTVMRGASFPEGGPIFLGKIAWGCQISWGAKFPVTPGVRESACSADTKIVLVQCYILASVCLSVCTSHVCQVMSLRYYATIAMSVVEANGNLQAQ